LLDRLVYWLFRLAILVTRPLPLRLGYWFGERVALEPIKAGMVARGTPEA